MKRSNKTAISLRKCGANGKYYADVYDDSIPKRAYRLCLLGLSKTELAVAFGVDPQIITSWEKQYPLFKKALKYGRAEADGRVAESLYRKAIGFKRKETVVKVTNSGDVVEHTYTKQYNPDTTACIFWLKNRHRDKWADIWKMEVEKGKDISSGQNNLADFSDEELKVLQKYSLVQNLQTNEAPD